LSGPAPSATNTNNGRIGNLRSTNEYFRSLCFAPLILDHPGVVLVSKLLDGHNYGQWSRAVRITLSAKNNIGFINETIMMPPSSDLKFAIWQRCNHMVLSRILNSIHLDIASSTVIYTETAIEVWNDLKEIFS
jgi:hypothetical protein